MITRAKLPHMSGEDLKLWRSTLPGTFQARNGQTVKGWSQAKCASWYGIGLRTWQRWESGDTELPVHLIRAVASRQESLEAIIERVVA